MRLVARRAVRDMRAAAVLVAIVVLQALVALFLVGLFHAPRPHALPIAVVGSGPLVEGVAGQLDASPEFAVTRAPSGAAARALIAEREVYGAYAPLRSSGRVIVASAASPTVAGILQRTFADIDRRRGVDSAVVDARPLPADNSAAVTEYMLALIVALGAVVGAWLVELRAPSIRRGLTAALTRVAVVLGFAIVTGLALAGVAASYGVFDEHVLATAGVLALGVLGIATVTTLLTGMLGGVLGLVVPIGAFALVGVLGASGGTSAPELLPDVWRAIGGVLPGRAIVEGLRNVAYFDANAIGGPLVVLGAYAGAGSLLVPAAGALRGRR